MATTISPSAAILQDIVQNQGQELLRARRELEEAETSKASLGQKLAVAQEELRRLYETAPTETSTLADKNAPDIVYAATHAQLILSANPTNSLTLSDIHLQDVISTTVPTQSSASMNTTEETDHESSAPQTRSTSPESSLQPFCRRQSPFKITTMAKKLLGKGKRLYFRPYRRGHWQSRFPHEGDTTIRPQWTTGLE
ncbi:hypothetical protein PLICRDRAFT_392743 [Plicaturopsis crispa FD-325 SS-3]|nr:hypothetical protein PLICRDRAFT_392743 [Plicaturopsis crispa FD-325 SS-3]